MLRRLCGLFFIGAGTLHFTHTRWYVRIMPPYIPAHRELDYASGVAEIAGGVGLLSPSPHVRRSAGWWLIATLIAVFPANVHMALNADDFPDVPGGQAALWARLPVLGVFLAWVAAAMRR